MQRRPRRDYDRDMDDQASRVYQEPPVRAVRAVRDAMIEAPVVSLEDIATKLRFLLEVGGRWFDADGWDPASPRTSSATSRSPNNPARDLRERGKAAFDAMTRADKLAEDEHSRVRRTLHP